MRRIRSSSLIAMVFVAVLAIPAGAAQPAAPSYVSSEPADGEKLHQAPARVEVTFNEPLDESSDLTVKDSCGRTVDDGNVQVEANTISVGIKLKPSGQYVVSYDATGLAGITGTNAGSFQFEVHGGSDCGGSRGGGHGGHKKNGGGNDGGGGNDNNGAGGNHGTHGGGDGSGSGSGGSGQDHSSMTGHGSGSSGGHSATTPTGDGGGHSGMDHAGRGGKQGGKHSNKHGKGQGKGHEDGSHGLLDILKENEADGRTTAAGEAGPFGPPDGTAVLLALGLSLGLGVLGGWFLRMSGAR